MTEIERLHAGLEYDLTDPEIEGLNINAIRLCQKLNSTDVKERAEREEIIRELFGSVGKNPVVRPSFQCDFGKHIHVGNNFFADHNVTILDSGEVHIGDNVTILPNCLIATVKNPMSPRRRRQHIATATPVKIGNDVWLGAFVTIFPGVTIGNNVVATVGSVITKDVPDNSLIGGSPAKVLTTLVDDTED